jgi:hypothetical protein
VKYKYETELCNSGVDTSVNLLFERRSSLSNRYISIDTTALRRAEAIEFTRHLYNAPCQPSRQTLSSVTCRGLAGRHKIFFNSHYDEQLSSTGAGSFATPSCSRSEAPSFGTPISVRYYL